MFETRKWLKQTNRLIIANSYTHIPRVSKEGKKYRDKKVLEPQQSECVKRGELLDLVKTMLPPWFTPGEHFCITANRNVQCAPHRDRDNLGDVGAMFIGDFEGGALLTENGDRYEERGVWHRYDGARVKHWNKPITGGPNTQ